MKANSWLANATQELTKRGIGTARLDALVLLEDVTQQNRAWLLAHPEYTLTKPQTSTLNKHLIRRGNHTPLAYIRGKTEFYGRNFIINEHVLEPRPETETMIEQLKRLKIDNRHLQLFIDIGTGSGAIAITTKLELPDANVIASDIDDNCLKIAKQNANKHSVEIKFLYGDLLQPIQSLITGTTVLLCNLPYVPDTHQLNQAAMHEPRHAIFGGNDGLDLYRHLFAQLNTLAAKPSFVLTESLPSQHDRLTKIAQKHGFRLSTVDDFIQIFAFNM